MAWKPSLEPPAAREPQLRHRLASGCKLAPSRAGSGAGRHRRMSSCESLRIRCPFVWPLRLVNHGSMGSIRAATHILDAPSTHILDAPSAHTRLSPHRSCECGYTSASRRIDAHRRPASASSPPCVMKDTRLADSASSPPPPPCHGQGGQPAPLRRITGARRPSRGGRRVLARGGRHPRACVPLHGRGRSCA